MDSSISKTRGQALVEVTVVLAVILFTVSAIIAIEATIKKQIKHDFVERQNSNLNERASTSSIEDQLKDKTRFFSKQKTEEILEQLKSEGWGEDRRLKVPDGLVISLSNGSKHMDLVHHKNENLGVFY